MNWWNLSGLGNSLRGVKKLEKAAKSGLILPAAIGGLTRFRPQRKRAFFTRETQEMPDPGLTPHAPKIRHIY